MVFISFAKMSPKAAVSIRVSTENINILFKSSKNSPTIGILVIFFRFLYPCAAFFERMDQGMPHIPREKGNYPPADFAPSRKIKMTGNIPHFIHEMQFNRL